VAVIQLAIGMGATVGGVIFDLSGVRATFAASAALLLLAAALATVAARAKEHSGRAHSAV
jgi:predicted MFS family arabinose efflux permease